MMTLKIKFKKKLLRVYMLVQIALIIILIKEKTIAQNMESNTEFDYFFALTFVNTYDTSVELCYDVNSITTYANLLKQDLYLDCNVDIEQSELYQLNNYAAKQYHPNSKAYFLDNDFGSGQKEGCKIYIDEYLQGDENSKLRDDFKGDILSYYYYKFASNCELLTPYWIFETGIQFSPQFWRSMLEFMPQLKTIIYQHKYSILSKVRAIKTEPFYHIDDIDCQILLNNFDKLNGSALELKFLKSLLLNWKLGKYKIIFSNSLLNFD